MVTWGLSMCHRSPMPATGPTPLGGWMGTLIRPGPEGSSARPNLARGAPTRSGRVLAEMEAEPLRGPDADVCLRQAGYRFKAPDALIASLFDAG